jgi:hypothetical protein
MDTETAPSPQPPKITVRALADPVVDELGFAPTSRYVEACWLVIPSGWPCLTSSL